MNEEDVNNLIEKYMTNSQYGVTKIPSHLHNGVDTARINPQDLLGFPCISKTTASVAPTDAPQNGTIIFQYDATHWYLWARVNNLWKSVALS